MTALAFLLLALTVGPVDLAAQASLGPRRDIVWSAASSAPAPAPIDFPGVSTGIVTAASLALPGTGQLLLRQKRFAVYAGFEFAGWLVHLDQRRYGHQLRNQYFDLAWMVARSGGPQPRREGDWEYYERLGSWERSGRFDADPARSGVQPEQDVESFNGATWALARDIFLTEGAGAGDPSYAKAIAYYESRAYPTELAWDWANQETSLLHYRSLITESDEALRTATVVLGAVVANHLFSAVDAFVSSHVTSSPVSAGVGLRAFPTGLALAWTVGIRP